MGDWPEEARAAVIAAIDDRCLAGGLDISLQETWLLATAMLDAAAPVLAEAWGAFESEPLQASTVPASFAAANATRTRTAGYRDAGSAAMILAQFGDTVTPRQRRVAEAKAAHPEASWSKIGTKVGMTKDQAANVFRRMKLQFGQQLETGED